jgi:nucleolar complex protein 2
MLCSPFHGPCCAGEDSEEEPLAAAQGSDDNTEDEDAAAAADDARAAQTGDPVASDNMQLRGEVVRHRQQLEALKSKDPEFYA